MLAIFIKEKSSVLSVVFVFSDSKNVLVPSEPILLCAIKKWVKNEKKNQRIHRTSPRLRSVSEVFDFSDSPIAFNPSTPMPFHMNEHVEEKKYYIVSSIPKK